MVRIAGVAHAGSAQADRSPKMHRLNEATLGGGDFLVRPALSARQGFRILRAAIPHDGLAHLRAGITPQCALRMCRTELQKHHADGYNQGHGNERTGDGEGQQ